MNHISSQESQPIEHIAQSILILRGHRVLFDSELAVLYGVTTKRFNEQVKRNLARLPADFMFQLTAAELAAASQPRSGRPAARYDQPHAGVARDLGTGGG